MLTATGTTAALWLTATTLFAAGSTAVQDARNVSQAQNNPQTQSQQAVPSQHPPSVVPPAPQSFSTEGQAETDREQQRRRRAEIAAYRNAQRQVHAAQREQRRANQVSAMHRMLNPWSPASVRQSYQNAQAYQQAAQNLAGSMGASTSPYYEYYFHARGW